MISLILTICRFVIENLIQLSSAAYTTLHNLTTNRMSSTDSHHPASEARPPPSINHLVDGLTSDPQTWSNSSLLSVTQITPLGLKLLYDTALQMRALVQRQGGDNRLEHKILSSVREFQGRL